MSAAGKIQGRAKWADDVRGTLLLFALYLFLSLAGLALYITVGLLHR